MSHYRKIDVRIWNDEKFNSLTPTGKLSFFMLLTHPLLSALGAMRGTPEGLAAEIGMDPEQFMEGFRELLSKRLAEHDGEGRMIALPNFLKYNPPANVNGVKSWVTQLEYLPECPLKTLVIQRGRDAASRLKGSKEPLPEPFQEPQNIEHRAQKVDHNPQNQEEETSQGKRIRERVDADGVVHEEPWGGIS